MSDNTPVPGWYEDPEWPGWERRWDGTAWTDDRRSSSAAPPPPAQKLYVQSNRAGWALAWSICALVCCQLTAIPGFIMARNEIQDIDAGIADPSNRGIAMAAQIIGAIGLVFMVLVIGFIGIAILAG